MIKTKPTISVIIPTYNEEATVAAAVNRLKAMGVPEIIVADGGSTDDTVKLASGVKVAAAPKGRAVQMNFGARHAAGDILLFLHCDTQLPDSALTQIYKALEDPRVVGGAFKVKIDYPGLFFYLASLGSNLRAALTRIYFGDQAIFVRRKVFEQIGGFPNIPLLEDWEISRKLKRAGKTVLLPGPAVTSARRWLINGKWQTAWLMHKIKILYLLGAKPEDLRRMYTDKR